MSGDIKEQISNIDLLQIYPLLFAIFNGVDLKENNCGVELI
jgi:hypothetical protein